MLKKIAILTSKDWTKYLLDSNTYDWAYRYINDKKNNVIKLDNYHKCIPIEWISLEMKFYYDNNEEIKKMIDDLKKIIEKNSEAQYTDFNSLISIPNGNNTKNITTIWNTKSDTNTNRPSKAITNKAKWLS